MDAFILEAWLNDMIYFWSRSRLVRTLCDDGGNEIATNLKIPAEKELHIWCAPGYSIEGMAEILGLPCNKEGFDDLLDKHSFKYKDFTIYGLVNKKEEC